MKSKILARKKPDLTLTFTEEEVKWLHGFIQNLPIGVDETEDEDKMREELFNCLKDYLQS